MQARRGGGGGGGGGSSLLVWLVCFLTSSSSITRLFRGPVPRLTFDNSTCCHTEAEQGDHDFCLRWSLYTDTDPTSRERAATARIEPGTSVTRSRALYRLSYRALGPYWRCGWLARSSKNHPGRLVCFSLQSAPLDLRTGQPIFPFATFASAFIGRHKL